MQPPARQVHSLARGTRAGSGRERCHAAILSALFWASLAWAVPGCSTMTHDRSPRTASWNAIGSSERLTVVRGQNPTAGNGGTPGQRGGDGPVTSVAQPSAPMPNPAALPPAIPELVPAPANFNPDRSGPGPIVEPTAPAQSEGWAPPGLSSIARNRLANRAIGQPAAAVSGGPGGARPFSGSSGSNMSGVSSILRNRLDRGATEGGQAQYEYPEIHAEPAQIYRDRFGVVNEEPDRFLFPWIVNLDLRRSVAAQRARPGDRAAEPAQPEAEGRHPRP